MEIIGYLGGALAFFICFIVPLLLTATSALALMKKSGKIFDNRRIYARTAIILGFFLSIMGLSWFDMYRWDEPLVYGEPMGEFIHQPFSEDAAFLLFFIAVGAVISLLILDGEKRLPPLAAVLCVSGIYAGMIFGLFYLVQLWGVWTYEHSGEVLGVKILVPCLTLYVANYVMCSARVLRETIKRYSDYFTESETASPSPSKVQMLSSTK